MTTPAFETAQIAETAYHIWLEEGQPVGRDEAHWYAAIDRLTPAPKKKAPARKPRTVKAKADADAKVPAKKAPAKSRSKKAAMA